MILAIDFDGVIHDYKNPVKGRRMGAPIEGAKEALDGFRARGANIIIFCVWGGTESGNVTIAKFMEYYKLPYDTITNVKPQCDYYIDDKAIRFTSWEDVLPQLK